MFLDDKFYSLQDGAPPHYHRDVTSLPRKHAKQKERKKNKYRVSSSLTEFLLVGASKYKVYGGKPKTLQELKNVIKEECLHVLYDTFESGCDSVKHLCEKCLQNGYQFRHM